MEINCNHSFVYTSVFNIENNIMTCMVCGFIKDKNQNPYEHEQHKQHKHLSINNTNFSCISCRTTDYVVDRDSSIVCKNCSVVGGYPDKISKMDHEMYYRSLSENRARKYKRLHYLNELLSQYFGSCPPMPNIFFFLLKEAFDKRRNSIELKKINSKSTRPPKVYKRLIQILCKSVCTAERRKKNKIKKIHWVELNLNTKSKLLRRYKKKNNFYDLRKYAEKWRFISTHLNIMGLQPRTLWVRNLLIGNWITFVKTNFLRVENAFETIRHNKSNQDRHNCRISKCKKSMISYPFIITKLTSLYFTNMEDKTLRDEIISWWPSVSHTNSKRIEERYWKPIVNHIISRGINEKAKQSWLLTLKQ